MHVSRPPRRPWHQVPIIGLLVLCFTHSSMAQISSARVEGLRDNTPRLHALTGARLVLAPGQVIENGTLVLKDGVVIAAGANVAVPAGARVWALEGRTIYPGFIDLASSLGVPANLKPVPPVPASQRGKAPSESKPLNARALANDNASVHPEQDVAQLLELKADDVKAVRELGFTTVLAAPSVGVFQGQSALLNLSDAASPRALVMHARVAQHMANAYGRGARAAYPSSLMGAIALARQTLLDARWYRAAAPANQERVEKDASLEALADVINGRQPVFYATQDELDYQRVARIRDEFSLRTILVGNGFEYRKAAYLKNANLPVVVPLTYPAPPEVENPDTALDTSLESLQHWEQAASNLALLNRAGVEFAVTAAGLKDAKKDFWANLRQAVRRGLPVDKALAALTSVPAKLVGEQARIGSLTPGHMANLVVARGDLFSDESATIEMSFVDGRPYKTESFERFDPRGTWSVAGAIPGTASTWQITGTVQKPLLTLDGKTCDLSVRNNQLSLRLPCSGTPEKAASAPNAAASALGATPAPAPTLPTFTINAEGRADSLRGSVQSAQGAINVWSATRSAAFVEKATPPKPEVLPPALSASYPFGAFGIGTPERPASVLVRNATIWTSAAAGRLEQADLLVKDGKIAAVGKQLSTPQGALVIDAQGKHVTPGIIDAHSHTAISHGVNEATSSVTAEVRIGDVLDPTDIGIYRELAGGVTAANLLHGSANTIGGQNQMIKLRWGMDAEALKLDGAIPGIKFALGENVKQSNWGEANVTRYPQTRMGVEQILRDAFSAARAYRTERAAFAKAPQGKLEPRRNLQLDTLVEILEKKRVVHVHSYRQDEILMFARLAKEFDITVATFQHVLEGYKVADAIASIGAGGSTFSDWWGYKVEVADAIPHNGAIMARAGVVTSFNSDSDELARRLNTEAAKAVKYGGLSETDALAFVTINPARQMRIDGRTGSLEVGKDADFVIWNGNPLSNFSRAEQTWIEGRRFFDLDTDTRLRAEAATERNRILAKALPARLSAMAGGGEAAAAKKPAGPTGLQNQAHISFDDLQQALHEARQDRGAYFSGAGSNQTLDEEE